jgi:hypothetical protein
MQTHRFLGELTPYSSSPPLVPATSVASFVAWQLPYRPNTSESWVGVPDLYLLAYQQAQAALRPTWYERCLSASLN